MDQEPSTQPAHARVPPGTLVVAADLAPVPPEERIHLLDVLRGFALFGILAANMRGFFAPAPVYFNPFLGWSDTANLSAQFFVDLLISGKFITIFSLLFGIGFAMQMDRARERAGSFPLFYCRRMLVLLLLGAAHAFLLWFGDILINYAICGGVLILFRRRSQKTLFWWATACYWLPALLYAGTYAASAAGVAMPPTPEPTRQALDATIRTYAHGDWLEIFSARWKEWVQLNKWFAFGFFRVLGVFLYGMWIWRTGILADPMSRIGFSRHLFGAGLLIGLPGMLAATGIQYWYRPNPMPPSLAMIAYFLLASVAVPFLSVCYCAAIIRLFDRPGWYERLMVFAPVGRMALTNYLLQSVLCTFIAYSYGLGLYGRYGPLALLAPTFAIYGLQVFLSDLWVERFRYGPIEWIWRKLSYGRVPAAAEAHT